MKKLLLLGVIVLMGLVVGQLGGAASPVGTTEAKPKFFALSGVMEKGGGQTSIHLIIEDAVEKSGVCPYYTKRLQFSKNTKSLKITVFQEPCFNEAFGVSRGDVVWSVPSSLQVGGASLNVTVSNEAGESDTFSLAYDAQVKAFILK